MSKHFTATAAAIAFSSLVAPAANAGIVINITQEGNDVVAATSGFIDTADLDFLKTVVGGAVKNMNPSLGRVATGASGAMSVFEGFTGPSSFGTNKQIDTLLQSGTAFTFNGSLGQLSIDSAYVRNTNFTSSTTWANKTLAFLGAQTGRYDYSYNGQTVVISVGSTLETPVFVPGGAGGVPEPATWAMLILGMGFVGGAMRQHARRAKLRFA